jgi:hypothetical protein
MDQVRRRHPCRHKPLLPPNPRTSTRRLDTNF